MSVISSAVPLAARELRLAAARRDSAVAQALLDGHRQADVASLAGISQPAISQMMRRRRTTTIGARWTIPVLAARLADSPSLAVSDTVRLCAQFSSDFRALTDHIDQEIALGAPELIDVAHLDALVAGLADYEAWRAGLETPGWAISARYTHFPSWFAAPTEGLKAYVMQQTPPQFSVRGVFIDERDLESV